MPADDDDDDDAGGGADAPGMQAAQFIAHTPVITFEDVKQRDILLVALLKNMREKQRRSMCSLDKEHFARICDGPQLYQELVEEYYPEFAGWENKRAIVGGVPPYDDTDGSWAVYFRGLHKSDQIRDACSDFLRDKRLSRLKTQTTPASHLIYFDRCYYHFPMGENERRDEREVFLTTHPTGIASAAANAGRPRYEDAEFPWREFYFFLLERRPAMRPQDPRLLMPIDEEYQLRAELFIVDQSHEMHVELRRIKRRFFRDGPFTWVTFTMSFTNARLFAVIEHLYNVQSNWTSIEALRNLTTETRHATQLDTLLLMMQPGGLYASPQLTPQIEEGLGDVLQVVRPGVSLRNRWRLIGFQSAVQFGNTTSVGALLTAYVGDWLLDRTYFLPWAVRQARTSVLQMLIDVDELILTSAVSEKVGAEAYRWWWFDVSRQVIREHWNWWQTKALSALPSEDFSPRERKKRALLKKLFDPVKGTKGLLTGVTALDLFRSATTTTTRPATSTTATATTSTSPSPSMAED